MDIHNLVTKIINHHIQKLKENYPTEKKGIVRIITGGVKEIWDRDIPFYGKLINSLEDWRDWIWYNYGGLKDGCKAEDIKQVLEPFSMIYLRILQEKMSQKDEKFLIDSLNSCAFEIEHFAGKKGIFISVLEKHLLNVTILVKTWFGRKISDAIVTPLDKNGLPIGEYKNGLFEGDYITNKKGLVKVQLFPNDYTFRISKKNKEKVITKSITNDLRIKCNLSLF